jgi:hypothetical protein
MLSDRFGVPYIELDGIFHQPNWTQLPAPEFEQRVQAAAAGPSWMIDGSYSAVRLVIWPRSTASFGSTCRARSSPTVSLHRTVVRCARRRG